MKIRTRGNSDPHGKRRVLFSCLPKDFKKTYDLICEDIFRTHDVAIYYMDKEYDDEKDYETDMLQINLVVIPVTFKLLNNDNNTMNRDLKFAIEHNIPVLPIMIEQGIYEVYSRKDKFSRMHYLARYERKNESESYEEKLKKYLENVLIGDELAERVRKAFDAYVFLSYRKKDRRYASELMRFIHKDPVCQDIAIWYDEYLVPGEEFDRAIEKALEKSDLFTLLVTPNLVNEDNYIQEHEYPKAHDSGISILPVEVVKTNRKKLEEKYEDIPECIRTEDESFFREQFLQSVSRMAKTENDDPEHNYLIGLAYLDGIDVEVDKERAASLIKGSAEAGVIEAMEKLAYMYRDGNGVERDNQLYSEWYEKMVRQYEKTVAYDDDDLIVRQENLAIIYNTNGRADEAEQLLNKLVKIAEGKYGITDPFTMGLASCWVNVMDSFGDYKTALDLKETIYQVRKEQFGEDDPRTIDSLNSIAYGYGKMGKHKEALEYTKRVYEANLRIRGEVDRSTLLSLIGLANEYSALEDHYTACALFENSARLLEREFSKEDSVTLMAMNNIACEYMDLEEYDKAMEVFADVYIIQERIYGSDHPSTLTTLNNIGDLFYAIDDFESALGVFTDVMDSQKRVLGLFNPNTISTLANIGGTLASLGRYEEALGIFEEVYYRRKKVLDADHPETLFTQVLIASACLYTKDIERAKELSEEAYKGLKEVSGEDDTYTKIAHDLYVGLHE